MDPSNTNNNRLQLNFNFDDRNRGAYQANDHAYPTTPSTFPQPSPGFPPQANQGGYGQQVSNGYGGGYFMSNPYPPQYQQQMQANYSQALAPNPSQPHLQRQGGYNANDATNGLVHQFSHQNLGGGPNARQGNAGYARQANASPRPRTAGNAGQSQYGGFLNSPLPNGPVSQEPVDEKPPERQPEKYSQRVRQCSTGVGEFVSQYFKNSVTRARERNERQVHLEKYMSDPLVPSNRKDQRYANSVKSEADFLRFLRTKETPASFSSLKIIGKGAFGEVKLVQKRTNGQIYALKSLIKSEMFKKDQLAHVRAERDILAESDSPWVVKLYTTFQDSVFLYMLMEYLPGGDLMTMLIKYEIFTEDITRFYMAEIVLAIEAVHKLGYIHRDIKPDNILLDRLGHIKLTDFGLSTGFHKQHENSYYQQLLSGKSSKAKDRNSVSLDQINLTVSNRSQINTWRKSRRVMAYSTVGTPDYIAPEIFSGQGYSFECDWWSLGTIMFECLIGWPPFCAEDPHDTYRKIVAWRDTLYFPEDVQLGPEAEDLCRGLICDSSQRIGRGGATELKEHSFFRGVNWDQLRKIRAPFEPKLQSNVDTSYFPTDEIDQTDNSAALRAQALANQDENAAEMSLPFVGYTYKRFDAFRG